MVGRLMVEDEYTINVKVRRPLGEEACLAPPTITITPDSSLITLTPPDNSTLTYAHASKSVNGSPPMAVGCSTLPRSSASSRGSEWATLPHPSRHDAGGKPYGNGLEVALRSKEAPPASNFVGLSLNKNLGKQAYDSEEAPRLRQQQIMPPPPPPERRMAQGSLPLTVPVSPCSPDLPLSPPGGITHGCLPLPIIQVFADDSTHVATNRFTAPSKAVSPQDRATRQGSPRPVDRSPSHSAAGCLYVPRIPEHCKSESGMLYVPPVDEQHLRQSKKDGPPAKGNSRRKRAIEAGPNVQTPTAAPALLSDRELASPDTMVRTPPDAVPPRTASSKAAARALLAGVLGPRMDLSSPDSHSYNSLNSNRNYCNLEFRSPSPRQTMRQGCYSNNNNINNNRNNQYLTEESYNNSLNTYKSNQTSPFSSPDKRSPDDTGERVVEVYGGVTTNHAHAPPTTVSGRSGHVDPAHPQLVDPALLTSLDLESDHASPAHEMLVTDAPHSTRPHDLNHNNHAFAHKSAEDHVSGRAAKYMVTESGDLAGHDNYAFDHDILAGQDNYGYDPGYSSERSPEDEEGPPLYCSSSSSSSSAAAAAAQRERSPHPSREPRERNSLKVAPGEIINTLEVMRLVPFITESTTFQVTVIKNLRGLGLAVTGGVECDLPYAGLIRIKKLYPQTPAWLCGQLEVGDILLQANDNPLTGLTSHEALEMLRTVGQEVTLEICRPPPGTMGDGEDLPDGGNTLGVVSTSLTTPNTSHNYLSPSPSFSSCGEFEVQLTKVAGSLGFTLRKQDNSILGHTIRSLVKEPAISDGRLRPGDKIISVNSTDMCSLSHEEAIGFLRTCPDTVTLRLYRDAMQTPVSPVSPTEPDILAKPKPLRKEARDMLSDLAFRKQSPSNSPSLAGASGSPGTPRRRRLQKTPSPDIKSVVIDRWDSLVRKTEESLPGTPTLEKKTSLNSIRENEHEASPFGDSQTDESLSTTIRSRNSSASSSSLTASNSESRPKRPSFLDLSNGRGCPRKSQFTPPHEVDRSFPSPLGGNYPSADSLDSAPQLTSAHSDTPAFSHLQQGYQSVNLGALHPNEDSRLTNTTSDHNISSHDTDGPLQSGLLKWKGIVFTPEEEDAQSLQGSLHQEGEREGSPQSHKPKMVTIELNRGWNSRLGFSLQPKGENTVIKAIYADSVAAKDGRLKMGDIVVKVNGIDVVGWETESVIDLLRKTRGKISVTVLQPLS